jgi:uncharacterized protein YjiK
VAVDGPEPALAQEVTSVLSRYDFDNRTRRFDLPGRLDEVSGLTFTADGRLLAHDDERGRVQEIDPETGEVRKHFDLGSDGLRGDFEGIAAVGERLFLITSTGQLYEFREGADRTSVPYRLTDIGVGPSCEVEGLDYDPIDEVLILACKTVTPDRGDIVLPRLSLDPAVGVLPSLRIPRALLAPFDLGPDFAPSGVAVDAGGTILIVSGRNEALIEVSRDGRVVAGIRLRKGRHPQSEGLAIGTDGTLYIADEKNGQDARLSVYARHPAGGER